MSGGNSFRFDRRSSSRALNKNSAVFFCSPASPSSIHPWRSATTSDCTESRGRCCSNSCKVYCSAGKFRRPAWSSNRCSRSELKFNSRDITLPPSEEMFADGRTTSILSSIRPNFYSLLSVRSFLGRDRSARLPRAGSDNARKCPPTPENETAKLRSLTLPARAVVARPTSPHVRDDRSSKLAAFEQRRPLHLALEVVGDGLGTDRAVDARDDLVGRFGPA